MCLIHTLSEWCVQEAKQDIRCPHLLLHACCLGTGSLPDAEAQSSGSAVWPVNSRGLFLQWWGYRHAHTHNWLSIWVVGIQTRVFILQTKALTHQAVCSILIFITNEKRFATFNYCVYQNHWYLTGYLYYNKGIDLTCGSLSIVAFLSLSPSSLCMYACVCVWYWKAQCTMYLWNWST